MHVGEIETRGDKPGISQLVPPCYILDRGDYSISLR